MKFKKSEHGKLHGITLLCYMSARQPGSDLLVIQIMYMIRPIWSGEFNKCKVTVAKLFPTE